MNIKTVLEQVFEKVAAIEDRGELASYIPELAAVDASKFGVFISTLDELEYGLGHCNEKFSIQSIAKVLALTLAYRSVGEVIWKRVGVEPSGTPFNSLVQLEADNGIPRNPFINAGAMVISDILLSALENPKEDFLAFVRDISGNETISYSARIAQSEKESGYRNVALCNFIKSLGNIENPPAAVLDFYFDLCSIEMSCRELAHLFLFLAHNGSAWPSEKTVLNEAQSKRINALMQTCGFYDESGEFAFKVGLPGKSGVGGGIIAIHPDKYAIAVWSPKLNAKGNSYKGMRLLEEFTTQSNLSIF